VSDKKSRNDGPNAQYLYLIRNPVRTRVILDHDRTRKVSTPPFDLPHQSLFQLQGNSNTHLPDQTQGPLRRVIVSIDIHSSEENSAIMVIRECKKRGSAFHPRLHCLRFVESDWKDFSVQHRNMTKRHVVSVIDENGRPRRVILSMMNRGGCLSLVHLQIRSAMAREYRVKRRSMLVTRSTSLTSRRGKDCLHRQFSLGYCEI